jgi:hypothetical protein
VSYSRGPILIELFPNFDSQIESGLSSNAKEIGVGPGAAWEVQTSILNRIIMPGNHI